MIALALKIFRWLLTIEFDRVESHEKDEPAEDIIPVRQFRIGFASPDDEGDDQDDEDEDDEETGDTW